MTELVGLRVELPEVFDAIHRLPFSLVKDGKVTGLRVDHPDGLWDPTTYFERLQSAAASMAGKEFYIVAEKILTRDEHLPQSWPVAGTTGYDFLNRLNGLFIDSSAEPEFDRLYTEFAGNAADFVDAVRSGKRTILSTSLKAELNQLARRLKRLLEGYDCSVDNVLDALSGVIVNFPVYRTYLNEQSTHPTNAETRYINQAVAETLAIRPHIEGDLLRLIRSILLRCIPIPNSRGFGNL